jgi:molybdopterin-guanine dinucleotide biosynthesis protein B
MIPVVAIVGHSKSGKTTLIEGLIAELRRRGRRAAAVKHAHQDFDLDHPGTDSRRYADAGCESIAVVGPRRSAQIRRHGPGYPFSAILTEAGRGADVVLVEGLSGGPYPKIEVYRAALGRGLRCDPGDLLAVVSDDPAPEGCRRFAAQDVGGVADFLEAHAESGPAGRTTLQVNGDEVPLGAFTQTIVANTILGLISSLKGVGAIETVSVSIRGARDAGSAVPTP